MKAFEVTAFILWMSCVFATKINYSGYKLIRITAQDAAQWEEVKSLQRLGALQVFSNRPKIGYLLPPHLASNLIDGIKEAGQLQVEVVIEDVQKEIDSHKVNDKPVVNGELEWDRYYELADIHQFIEDQAEKHNSTASVFSLGQTYEGREMKAIRISKSGETKPAVWIDSLIHAREYVIIASLSTQRWITGAVCTFIIDQILNSEDPEVQGWLDEYDFYILPVLNPDGYEFTHTSDRFWRKSRSKNGSPIGCMGTDLNRNFDFHWLENGGASSDPCSLTFAGTKVFSDAEAVNVKNFLESISSRLKFYLSLHSAGQFILFSTGFDATPISQYNTYMALGNLAAEAHKEKYGTVFKPGSVFNEMYVATGSSMDWAKHSLKPTLAFTYELRDKGQYGHLLPPDQIYPSALEFMDGLKVIMRELKGIPETDP